MHCCTVALQWPFGVTVITGLLGGGTRSPGYRIVRVAGSDVTGPSASSRFEELWSFVAKDVSHSLGSPLPEELASGSHAVLLCFSGRQIVGVLWIERLEDDVKLSEVTALGCKSVEAGPDLHERQLSKQVSNRKARLGVRLIWVHRPSRKKNLAASLVDAARMYAGGLGGISLPAEEVAFSQPTEQGLAFATRYTKAACGKPCALVYAP